MFSINLIGIVHLNYFHFSNSHMRKCRCNVVTAPFLLSTNGKIQLTAVFFVSSLSLRIELVNHEMCQCFVFHPNGTITECPSKLSLFISTQLITHHCVHHFVIPNPSRHPMPMHLHTNADRVMGIESQKKQNITTFDVCAIMTI